MQDATETRWKAVPILADADADTRFAAFDDAGEGESAKALAAIAAKIGKTRKPGAESGIPAGATYLAQFAIHDLDLHGREDRFGGPRLDLALIYGDGPRHDAFAYQVPTGPGEPRSLLRVGRARPAWNSPAWGATRDLPRTACPHLDSNGAETRSEVLIPNTFSDSNLLLGQVQTLWALLHNALATAVADRCADPESAFEAARRVTRHVYRNTLVHDVLGTWLLPAVRGRYAREAPDRLSTAPLTAMPRSFLTGVARVGHCLVREVYALNDERRFEGLRSLVRQTSTGRPSDMPLTEDWLLDFSRFFDLGATKAQRARALGPHVARPFRLGGGVGLDAPSPNDGLVLRDLVASTRNGSPSEGPMPSIRSLVARIGAVAPGLLEGCFAQDERRRHARLADWLADVDIAPQLKKTLAEDPPLTLFLMIEAEEDAQGRSLGAVGSILMAETLTGALPEPAPAEDLALARETVFRGAVPTRMAELIEVLQRHYKFPDGARLHQSDHDRPTSPNPSKRQPPEATMLDDQNSAESPAGLVEVADYIELGRLVADWTLYHDTRPDCVDDLRRQLDGIAKVPANIKDVEFVQGRPDVLIIRLPERDLMKARKDNLEGPAGTAPYKLPKFYDDIYHRHFGPEMSPLETFLARMGDYTIAQCR